MIYVQYKNAHATVLLFLVRIHLSRYMSRTHPHHLRTGVDKKGHMTESEPHEAENISNISQFI